MKKLIYLLAIGFVFAGCEKTILKRTTVQVISKDAAVHVDFPNDAKKYLDDYSEAELTEMYIQTFKDELGKRKIDIVDADADYIIEIKDVHLNEFVTSENEDGQWIDLSRIDMVGVYTVTQSLVDVPERLEVDESVEEEINTGKKNKDKKNKGGKYYNGVDIDTFGGAPGALEEHAKEVRKELKKIIKSNQ